MIGRYGLGYSMTADGNPYPDLISPGFTVGPEGPQHQTSPVSSDGSPLVPKKKMSTWVMVGAGLAAAGAGFLLMRRK